MRALCLAAIFMVTPATATTPLEDLDALDLRIGAWLGQREAQPIDRRLRLLRCPEGAVIAPPAGGTVVASCPSKGWRISVPLIGAVAVPPRGEIVIHRGDAVELAFAGNGFAVTTSAVAVDDGREGGMVRVKSPTGASVVTARVRGPGSASIGD